jgi:hypothetical protein
MVLHNFGIPFFYVGTELYGTDRVVDLAENVADDGAEDQKNGNYYDSNQNKDQSILNEALGFFFRGK